MGNHYSHEALKDTSLTETTPISRPFKGKNTNTNGKFMNLRI